MREDLFKCYCESRKVQLIISKVLNNSNLNNEEKNLLQDVTLEIQNATNKIKCFCEQVNTDKK